MTATILRRNLKHFESLQDLISDLFDDIAFHEHEDVRDFSQRDISIFLCPSRSSSLVLNLRSLSKASLS
jgi:hypothetical protein